MIRRYCVTIAIGIISLISAGVAWAIPSVTCSNISCPANSSAVHSTVLIAMADTRIDSGSPDMNWGDWDNIRVGSDDYFGNMRGLVGGFEIDAIPEDAVIVEAKLALWYYLSSYPRRDMTVTAYRITRSWSEMEATWTNMASAFGEPYGSDTISAEDDDRWTDIDVTGLVQGWVAGTIPNYGIGLIGHEGPPENYKYFSSREKGAGWEPRIIVEWTVPTPTPTPIPTPIPRPYNIYLPIILKLWAR